jgi:hypothetical protein
VQTPDASGGGLLVVRAADDEASTSLALAQLSGWLAATAARLSQPQTWMRLYAIMAAVGLALAILPNPATPPGRHDVIQRPIKGAEVGGLAHSSLYDDTQVIGWAVDHLKA